jgi:predicted dehydrogenase
MPDAFRIVALANRTRAKVEDFARAIGGAKVYDDYRALLDDSGVNAILTAVPVQLNAQILIDSVRAGKHVLAEKPIAATPAEAREALRACKNSRKVIAIAENFRYREDVNKARAIIAGGEIGDVYCFQITTKYDVGTEFRRAWFEKGTWRHSPVYPGGMFTDTSIHMISSLRDMLGEVKELYAQVLDTSPATEGPDCLVTQITMSNGAVGQYLACFSAKVAKETVFSFAAFGKTGSLRLSEGEVVWLLAPGTEALSYRPEGYDRGHTNQWRNFHRAICGEEAVVSTPEQGLPRPPGDRCGATLGQFGRKSARRLRTRRSEMRAFQ